MELATADAPPPLAVADYGPLPTDVLLDILLRLPADEVCRLRVVCRTWRSLTSDPHFARAHASRHPQPHVIVVRHYDGDDEAEVRAVDLHGNVINRWPIRRPIIGRLSIHGDLLCASHGWGLTCVVDMFTGAVADVAAEPRKKVNSATPHCVLGHVPATGEYKVLRVQADYLSRPRRQKCEVVTLGGGGGDAGTWRRRTCFPVTLGIKPGSSSWNVAIAGGLAYFLVEELDVEADRLAVFDLATEEWKPEMLQGPLTTSILAASPEPEEEVEEEEDELLLELFAPYDPPNPLLLLRRKHFQLARLGESLVVLYCNVKNGSTELWFLEDVEDDTTAHWCKRYTLQGTTFGDDDESPVYHYPVAILDDGRILVWVEKISALRAYDPETCTWTDLATLTGDCVVVGMHHGSLLCSNLGAAAQPLSFFEEASMASRTSRWPRHLCDMLAFCGDITFIDLVLIWFLYYLLDWLRTLLVV